jgi:hypothetical protein
MTAVTSVCVCVCVCVCEIKSSNVVIRCPTMCNKSSHQSKSWQHTMNFEGHRRKWLWHILMHYNGIFLEEPRIIGNILIQESPPRAGFEPDPSRKQVHLLDAPHMRMEYYPWLSHKSGWANFQFNFCNCLFNNARNIDNILVHGVRKSYRL